MSRFVSLPVELIDQIASYLTLLEAFALAESGVCPPGERFALFASLYSLESIPKPKTLDVYFEDSNYLDFDTLLGLLMLNELPLNLVDLMST